jgi:hypothetical protein
MRFRYSLLYRPYGLSLPKGQTTRSLPTSTRDGLVAILTSDVDPIVTELDRYFAIANRMLGGIGGGGPGSTLEDSIAAVRKTRAKYGNGPFLVVTALGEYPWQPPEHMEEIDGIVAADGPGRGPLKEVILPALKRFMCALFLSTPRLVRTDLLSDAGVLLPDDGSPVYPYRLGMSAKAYLGNPITDEIDYRLRRIGDSLVANGSFERVASLIADSLDNERDPLRAFLFGWSALEILVNKLFGTYEAVFAADLSRAKSALGHQHYLRRVREVMKDRVRLTDKFAIVAAALTPNTEDADTATFKRLKDIRDSLLHGTLSAGDAELPHTEPAALVKQLLVAHLESTQPARLPVV